MQPKSSSTSTEHDEADVHGHFESESLVKLRRDIAIRGKARGERLQRALGSSSRFSQNLTGSTSELSHQTMPREEPSQTLSDNSDSLIEDQTESVTDTDSDSSKSNRRTKERPPTSHHKLTSLKKALSKSDTGTKLNSQISSSLPLASTQSPPRSLSPPIQSLKQKRPRVLKEVAVCVNCKRAGGRKKKLIRYYFSLVRQIDCESQ